MPRPGRFRACCSRSNCSLRRHGWAAAGPPLLAVVLGSGIWVAVGRRIEFGSAIELRSRIGGTPLNPTAIGLVVSIPERLFGSAANARRWRSRLHDYRGERIETLDPHVWLMDGAPRWSSDARVVSCAAVTD